MARWNDDRMNYLVVPSAPRVEIAEEISAVHCCWWTAVESDLGVDVVEALTTAGLARQMTCWSLSRQSHSVNLHSPGGRGEAHFSPGCPLRGTAIGKQQGPGQE